MSTTMYSIRKYTVQDSELKGFLQGIYFKVLYLEP